MIRAKGQGLFMTVASEQDRDIAPMPVSNMAACTRPAKTQHGYKKGPSPRKELEVVTLQRDREPVFALFLFFLLFLIPQE